MSRSDANASSRMYLAMTFLSGSCGLVGYPPSATRISSSAVGASIRSGFSLSSARNLATYCTIWPRCHVGPWPNAAYLPCLIGSRGPCKSLRPWGRGHGCRDHGWPATGTGCFVLAITADWLSGPPLLGI
jgi:hypothetical protein